MSTINADYQRKLLKKWSMIVESTPAGCSKINSVTDKINLAAVLENTYKYLRKHGCFLTEANNTVNPVLTPASPGYNATNGVLGKDDFVFPNLITPMIRRIYPTLMAHELVSVQPMNGPVGYAMALRVMGPNGNNPDYVNGPNFEYGYEGTVGTTGQKVDPGSSSAAQDKFNRRGNGVRGAGRPTTQAEGFGDNPVFGRFGASGEQGKYPTAAINIVKQLVQAEERKLGSEWSPELAEDFEAMYGIDIETEMVNNISFQIGAETDQQILDKMVDAGVEGGVVSWKAAQADGLDQMGRIATLLTSVTKAANDIAITTRRGSGNFVVASVNVCSALQQLGSQKLVTDGKTMPSVPASAIGSLSKEGLINNGRQLLVKDTYAEVDYALVGYKGTQTGDSGIIYCPYIPVTLVKTLDPYTLSPRIGARTRYGIGDNPYDSKNFYKVIRCDFSGEYQFSSANRYFFGGSDAAGIAQSISISQEPALQPDSGNDGDGTGAVAPAPKRVRKVVAE